MTLPTFIGIGVQRSATTWLHDCLKAHPNVFLPDSKELSFFNNERLYSQGESWYRSQFSGHRGEAAVGEITPLYLHSASIELMYEMCPNAQLILILREPADRAYSAYTLLRHHYFPHDSFPDAVKSQRGQCILEYSLYADRILNLLQFFPRKSILVETYDSVRKEPIDLYSRVCDHIGVDSHFVPEIIHTVKNRIIFPRAQQVIQSIGLESVLERTKNSVMGNLMRKWSEKQKNKESVVGDVRDFRESHADLFREDILKCQELLDVDLSSWL